MLDLLTREITATGTGDRNVSNLSILTLDGVALYSRD